jgi:hypothetical protein
MGQKVHVNKGKGVSKVSKHPEINRLNLYERLAP